MRLGDVTVGLQVVDSRRVVNNCRALVDGSIKFDCATAHRLSHICPLRLLGRSDLERAVQIGDVFLDLRIAFGIRRRHRRAGCGRWTRCLREGTATEKCECEYGDDGLHEVLPTDREMSGIRASIEKLRQTRSTPRLRKRALAHALPLPSSDPTLAQ